MFADNMKQANRINDFMSTDPSPKKLLQTDEGFFHIHIIIFINFLLLIFEFKITK